MSPPNILSLTVRVDGQAAPLRFPVGRVVNAGYVGRDQDAVRAHVEELAREGVPPPASVPMLFPLAVDRLTTAERIEVVGSQTSGEVEYVLLQQGGELFVGVGSDHTDRDLERHSIIKSKQICNNVLSSEVWRYRDVAARWDTLLLQSWVRLPGADQEVLYQSARLESILPAGRLLDLVESRLGPSRPGEGLVLFSGTIPVLTGRMIYASSFRAELVDESTSQRLSCAYHVCQLDRSQAL